MIVCFGVEIISPEETAIVVMRATNKTRVMTEDLVMARLPFLPKTASDQRSAESELFEL